MSKPKTQRRYLLTEAKLLAAVDSAVTLPQSAIDLMLAYLAARPALAPAWLQIPKQKAGKS